MTRIEPQDTLIDVVTKMSGDNPGALTVCMDILERGAQIDPDGALGGLGALLSIDTHGIYDHRIWMFYKNVCGEDLPTMLAVDRARQLGLINDDDLNHAIDNYGNGIDIDDLIKKVRKQLPAFKINMVEEDK